MQPQVLKLREARRTSPGTPPAADRRLFHTTTGALDHADASRMLIGFAGSVMTLLAAQHTAHQGLGGSRPAVYLTVLIAFLMLQSCMIETICLVKEACICFGFMQAAPALHHQHTEHDVCAGQRRICCGW